MKKNVKITLCGIASALSVAFMLLSYFPYFTYAVPAVAGLITVMLVIETDVRWAFASYIVSSVLIFLLAEPESKLMYICLFGYYPIVKSLIERINKNVLEWVLKLLVFNVAVIAVYFLFASAFSISLEEFGALGKYGVFIFLWFGNLVFLLYDYTISRLAGTYIYKLHPKIKKIFKF